MSYGPPDRQQIHNYETPNRFKIKTVWIFVGGPEGRNQIIRSGEDPGKGDVTRVPAAPPVIRPQYHVDQPDTGGRRSQRLRKSPQTETDQVHILESAQERQRKQKIMPRLCDSGIEEDLGWEVSSNCSQAGAASSLLHEEPESPAGQVSTWYLQYGDIGYKIQREKEALFHPCQSLAHQPQLDAESRCKLVSWLIPVHKHLHLSFECCCLSINIMDRFLASTPLAADCFQLLGVTTLLLASKQVEVCSPSISHLLSLCCDAFTKEQLCNLECFILIRLNFCLAAPTLAFFLDYYTNCMEAAQLESANTGGQESTLKSSNTQISRQCSRLAKRVCELSLADYAFNKYLPSLTASCALMLAIELVKTQQGLDKPKRPVPELIQAKDDQWDSFVELSISKDSLGGSNQPAETLQRPELGSLEENCHFLSVDQEGYDHNLTEECRENLKLLVTLNQDILEVVM
ncbi:cyclin-O [Thalassophryne amazonica]|uniref:cyclin-O n=1 Tax=Thalassophryne amazonica TaxID=390379 RepID=UPI0014721910|nr:cyclin-O [Thalassophryne amazonica]